MKAAYTRMFTVMGEMRDEMAGKSSTSGSRACCRTAFYLPPGQSTQRRSPALTMVSTCLQRCAIMYICTLHTHPVLILVTRPSCVNLANSIKCMGDSRSYLSYHRSHYALLLWPYKTVLIDSVPPCKLGFIVCTSCSSFLAFLNSIGHATWHRWIMLKFLRNDQIT